MSSRIYYDPDKFQKLMDAMTKWQRVAILMKIALSQLGHEAEASRLMKLTKEQAGEELERWQNAAGIAPDEPVAPNDDERGNVWPRGCPGCEHSQLLCSSCLRKLQDTFS